MYNPLIGTFIHNNCEVRAAAMEKTDLLVYKNLLLSKRQELSNGKSRADSNPTISERHGDPVDVAASETDAFTQIQLHQTDGKLLRAIEDALTRIQREKFGVCEECGEPISKARLEAVPWTRWCRDCKERQDSQK
jgi:DnaK suppressor protein